MINREVMQMMRRRVGCGYDGWCYEQEKVVSKTICMSRSVRSQGRVEGNR